MQEIKAKKLIKLGAAVRYLIDVKYKISNKYTKDEPLGDGHVIDNINHVLDLISELKLTGTLEAGAYGKLQRIQNELNTQIRTVTTINLEQAEHLSEICRILRGSLLSEGNNVLTYYLDSREVESVRSLGWPEKITLELLKKTPWNIWTWVGGAIFFLFGTGVTVGELGFPSKIVSFFHSSKAETTVPAPVPGGKLEPEGIKPAPPTSIGGK